MRADRDTVSRPISIRGDGITACCCARLLRTSGFKVAVSNAPRPRMAAILVGDRSQALLNDVFGDTDLFRGMAAVRKRIVLWGMQSKPVILPHSAAVVPESAILQRMWSTVPPGPDEVSEADNWTIVASPPLPSDTFTCDFGSRTAFTNTVDLAPRAESEACWIESLENGWLFLLNVGNGRGSLISVGEAPESLLANSRLVGERVSGLGDATGRFSAHPRILSRLCGEKWLACGPAAVGFDPLCGDGTGNAVREAILACAAIRGIFRGFDAADVLAHYSFRLNAGFLRHLELCRNFYLEARSGAWWEAEIARLDAGIASIRKQIADTAGPPRYRLDNFDLQQIIPA